MALLLLEEVREGESRNKGVHMSEAGQRYIRLIRAKETHRYLFGGHSRPQRISS